MREILNRRLSRSLSLLEKLYISDINIKKLGLNYTTLKNDVENINAIITPMKVVTKEGYMHLEQPRDYSIAYIYSCFLNESIEFQLLELIFLKGHVSIKNSSEYLFSSESTLRRIIKKINQRFIKGNKKIRLLLKNDSLSLDGEDLTIVKFYLPYFIEKYTIDQQMPFKKIEMDNVNDSLEYVKKSMNVHYMDYGLMRKLRILTMLLITQIKNAKSKNTELVENNLIEEKMLKLHEKFLPLVSETQANKVLFYLQQLFEEYGIYVNKKNEEKIKFTPVYQSSYRLLIEMEKYLSLEISEEIRNKNAIVLYHIEKNKLDSQFILFDQEKMFFYEFSEKFSGMQELVSILKKYNIGEKNHTFYSVCYTIIMLYEEQNYKKKIKRKKLNLGIFYTTDIRLSRLIEKEINENFGTIFNCEVIDSMTDNEFKKKINRFDSIITNVPKLLIEIDIICFPPYPKNKDWIALFNYYLERTENLF